ncbi:hypothetical protein BCD49_37985 [Pseudofrankia sp. EUN1h]|nr:hypothetical protein BCD49_37985 [Pseudofrankia sp. EUN1h]
MPARMRMTATSRVERPTPARQWIARCAPRWTSSVFSSASTMIFVKSKDADEWLACATLQAALGVKVVRNDDQSPQPRRSRQPRPNGRHDLTITYADGRRAAVEVVSTRDETAMGFSAASTSYTTVSRLTRTWVLVVSPEARIKDLKREAPAALARLEENGTTSLEGRGISDRRPQELRRLRVVSCVSTPPAEGNKAGFYLVQDFTAGWSGGSSDHGDLVVQRCNELLASAEKADVPRKLLASGLSERHAVVVVTFDWLDSLGSIESGALPRIAPTLPKGVDRLWLVIPREPGPIRAIYWLGDGRWRDVVLTEEQLEAPRGLFSG